MEKVEKERDTDNLPPRVIAVSSGKGGVGKSSITVNLGISLAKGGARVCLLDADTGLANANILLGLTPQFSLEHVLYGAKPIEEVMLDGPHGLKIVPGAHGISEVVNLHPRQQLRLTRELARIEEDFDYILIDTAAGISDTTLDFVSAAHHTLVVITPEPTSLTDAFSLIKLLKRRHSVVHYHVVVNMCSNGVQAKEVFHRFRSAVEKYIGVDVHYLGHILRDESMRAAVVLQNPVAMFPDSDPSSRGFLKLAESLDSMARSTAVKNSFSGFWNKQFREQRGRRGDNGEPPLRVAPPAPSQSRESDYLAELRSRLLLLIEQGHTDPPLVEVLLQEAVETFIRRYEYGPLDVLRQVEALVHSPDRDDQLMRDIAELVKPWGGFVAPPVAEIADPDINLLPDDADRPPPSQAAPIGDVQIRPAHKPQPDNPRQAEGDPDAAPAPNPAATDPLVASQNARDLASECLHHYDVRKFGSQEHLLDLLKRSSASDQSLVEFLDNLV